MIGHIMILSYFHHRWHLIWLVMTTRFHFWHRPHLYDRLCRYLIWFSSRAALSQIGPDSSILILALPRPIWSVTSLFYLVFIADHTQFDLWQQLNFVFCIDHIYKINHIVVLFGFCHNQHPILSSMKVQYYFRCKPHLYDQSCQCSICFSS